VKPVRGASGKVYLDHSDVNYLNLSTDIFEATISENAALHSIV